MTKNTFFKQMAQLGLALTFDDVRLKTGHARVRPGKVSVESRFSRNVPLKVPIVSAAMDTITEYPMAIAMAQLGGLGVLHKNMTPEQQAYHVKRVKHHLNGKTGLIEKPVTIDAGMSLNDILLLKEENGYPFHSFPVVKNGKLVGLITRNHFHFYSNEFDKKAEEVMITNLVTGTPSTTMDDAFALMQERMIKVLPLVDKAKGIAGLYVFRDLKAMKDGKAERYNLDVRGRLRVAAAVGVKDWERRVPLLAKEHVDCVVIDTAHGDTVEVIEAVKTIKKAHPELDVVAGNVTEPGSVARLVAAGADGVKVGQGPGSICTTRVIAGIGCPQVTATYNCATMAGDVPICADGGITYSGDIPIAIAAGASCVMLGSVLAGTDQTPGEVFFADGKQWKAYYGMGSLAAMRANAGSRERYQQSGTSPLVPEGIEGRVEYKGKLKNIFDQMEGGLRRGMAYVGAADIKELWKKAEFHRITHAGQAESHPHDVTITKEAPNYQRR